MKHCITPFDLSRFCKSILVGLVLTVLLASAAVAQRSYRVTSVNGYPTGWTPDSLVRHLLVDSTIDISNVAFNNRNDSIALTCSHIGFFLPDTTNANYRPSDLGIEAGIILSTGNVNKLQQAFYNYSEHHTSSRDPNCADISDADLQRMSDTTLHDHAVLSFDFVPQSDQFQFTFVFASEEYPDYVCSKFNDVFGFFLNGPKPGGGYYGTNYTWSTNSYENVAVIRDTLVNSINTIPITINTINGGHVGSVVDYTAATQSASCDTTHSAYYRDNPYDEDVNLVDIIMNWDTLRTEYNGMTTVITINVPVVACATYHLKIGIANAKDNHHDSDLLIKMNSMTSDTVVRKEQTMALCEGTALPFNWRYGDSTFHFTEVGTQYYHHGTAGLCDTLETLTLYQGSTTYDTITDTACNSYYWYNIPNASRSYYSSDFYKNRYFNTSGSYTTTFSNGNSQHCDSLLTLNLTVNNSTTGDYYDTIVYNDRPAIFRGNHYYSSGNRTFYLYGVNQWGCDSTIYYHLHIWPNVYTTVRDTICDSEMNPTYNWDSTIFTRPSSGKPTLMILYDTMLNCHGADSIITRRLTIRYSSSSTVRQSITENQLATYNYHGCTFGLGGVTDTVIHLTNYRGCDSAVTFSLIVYPNVSATADSAVCLNRMPLLWNGCNFTTAGSHVVTLMAHTGADSVLTMNVSLLDTSSYTLVDTVCDRYTFGNRQYTVSGNYARYHTAANGCDSVVHLVLTVNRSVSDTTSHYVIENNLPYTFCGVAFNDDVVDTVFHLSTHQGCDSLVHFSLTVHRNIEVRVDSTICYNQLAGFVWNDSTFAASGTKSTMLTSQVSGADSLVWMHLTVNPNTSSNVSDTIVENQLPYFFNDIAFADSIGDTVVIIPNVYGCDSVINYSLYVHWNVVAMADSTLCENSLPLRWNHRIFTDSGAQRDTLLAHTGADSVLTMHVNVLRNSNRTVYDTIRENDLPWQFCETIFADSISNTTVIIPNVAGCDSIITYSLCVHRNIRTIVDSTLCENLLPLVWNDSIFTTDGEKHRTFLSYTGADSVVTMRVHVLRNSYSTIVDTIVENDIPFDYQGRIFNDSISDTMIVIPNARGCDSVINYSLYVHWNVAATADSTLCENYLPLHWNNRTFTDSGTQFDTLRAHTGADSVLTMHVNVLRNSYHTVYDTILENDLPRQFCGQLFADSISNATVIIPNMAGCDSIITYSLYVHRNIHTTADSTLCENYLPLVWNDSVFADDGVKLRTFLSYTGADSVVTMRVHVLHNSSALLERYVVENDLPLLWEDSTFTTDDEKHFLIANAAGCDSAVTLRLHVWRNITVSCDSLPCESALPLVWNGVSFTTDSTASVTLAGAGSHGEDSTVVMHVQIIATTYATVYDTIVENQLPYNYHGWIFRDPAQDSVVTIPNAHGCDSIVTYSLYVHWNVYDTLAMAVCDNDLPIVWNGVVFPHAMTTRAILEAHTGADSIVVMMLYTYGNSYFTLFDTVVENQLPYNFNNSLLYNPVLDTLITIRGASENGCDSIIRYSLQVYYNQRTYDTVTVCDTELPYQWGQYLFTAAGNHVDTLATVHGADSLVYEHLVVKAHSSSIMHEAIVENQLPHHFVGATFHHAVADTTIIVTNAVGCDSIITYSLVVYPNITVYDSTTICSSQLPYTWNGVVFESAGRNSITLLRTTGADSIIVMILKVNPSHLIEEQYEACGFYTWRNGVTYTESNNEDTLLFYNRYHCDSVRLLDLTILNLTRGPDLYDTICITELPYETMDTLFLVGTESGSYPHVVPGSNGCDSLAVLHLTVLDLPMKEVEEVGFDCRRRCHIIVARHTEATTSVLWHSNPVDHSLEGQEGNDTIWVSPSRPTAYYATAKVDPQACSNSKSIIAAPVPPFEAHIEVHPPYATPDNLLLQFHDGSRGEIVEWEWMLPFYEGDSPSFSYDYPRDYDSIHALLIVTERRTQCHDTALLMVPYLGGVMWTPNAFTPDQPTNNIFLPKIHNMVKYEMFIFQRGGQMVFRTDDIEKGWDGTYDGRPCVQGSYVYLIITVR